jgi:hypothetical protein
VTGPVSVAALPTRIWTGSRLILLKSHRRRRCPLNGRMRIARPTQRQAGHESPLSTEALSKL